MFVVCYVTSNVVVCREIELFGITASASIIIYPLLYLILTLFRERYGKEKAVFLLNISVVAILFSSLLIMFASLFPISSVTDGLEPLFNNNLRILIASLAAFYLSQNLHLTIYDFLGYSKFFKFLVSAVIAVTADQIVFVFLAFIKKGVTISELTSRFTGQYTFNIMAIIIYALIFGVILYIKSNNSNLEKPKNKTKIK